MLLPLAQVGGIDFLEQSQSLLTETFESWQQIWDGFFDTSLPGFWTGLVVLGLSIAGLVFLHAFATWVPELASSDFSGRRTFELFWPILVVVALLGNDGLILSQLLLALRGIGLRLVRLPLDIQILGTQLRDVLAKIAAEGAATESIRQVIAACEGSVGDEFVQCLEGALEQAEEALSQIQARNPDVDISEVSGNLLSAIQGALNAVTPVGQVVSATSALSQLDDFFLDKSLYVIQILAYGMQWAFVNGVELVLIGAFGLTPIVLALLITPSGATASMAWISSLAGLYVTEFFYNTSIGFIALVIDLSDFSTIAGFKDLFLVLFSGTLAPIISLVVGFGVFTQILRSVLDTGRGLGAQAVGLGVGGVRGLGRLLGFGVRRLSR